MGGGAAICIPPGLPDPKLPAGLGGLWLPGGPAIARGALLPTLDEPLPDGWISSCSRVKSLKYPSVPLRLLNADDDEEEEEDGRYGSAAVSLPGYPPLLMPPSKHHSAPQAPRRVEPGFYRLLSYHGTFWVTTNRIIIGVFEEFAISSNFTHTIHVF